MRTRAFPIYLRGAFALFAVLSAVTTVAVHAVPHARGIGFIPQLRFAILTPICLLVAFGATVLYQCVESRSGSPGRTFAGIVSRTGVGQ
jgi:hypothetical protein